MGTTLRSASQYHASALTSATAAGNQDQSPVTAQPRVYFPVVQSHQAAGHQVELVVPKLSRPPETVQPPRHQAPVQQARHAKLHGGAGCQQQPRSPRAATQQPEEQWVNEVELEQENEKIELVVAR